MVGLGPPVPRDALLITSVVVVVSCAHRGQSLPAHRSHSGRLLSDQVGRPFGRPVNNPTASPRAMARSVSLLRQLRSAIPVCPLLGGYHCLLRDDCRR